MDYVAKESSTDGNTMIQNERDEKIEHTLSACIRLEAVRSA